MSNVRPHNQFTFMASVRINTEDVAPVTELVQAFGEFCGPAIPMLLIHWQGRAVDNKRGADGQVSWEQSAPAHWAVEIGSWVDTPERKIQETALQVQGLFAILDNKASSASGCFVISASKGRLVVSLEAT
jgi:hypothetical protein